MPNTQVALPARDVLLVRPGSFAHEFANEYPVKLLDSLILLDLLPVYRAELENIVHLSTTDYSLNERYRPRRVFLTGILKDIGAELEYRVFLPGNVKKGWSTR